MSEIDTGAILERAVRRSGISIAELARRIHVNRRSVYYWFSQKSLSPITVHKVGFILGHDFSIELAEAPYDYSAGTAAFGRDIYEVESASYWKSKYIDLLEKYNNQLERPEAMNIHLG